jgi:hypothetical protein
MIYLLRKQELNYKLIYEQRKNMSYFVQANEHDMSICKVSRLNVVHIVTINLFNDLNSWNFIHDINE